MKSKTTLQNLYTSLSNNNSSTNQTLGLQLINDAHRYLLQKYFNNETTYQTVTVSNQQGYDLPPNYSKMKDVVITVGQLNYTPIEITTRQDWDRINFLPYTSDIPEFYFIYNGQVNIFPIPSSNGNTITFNYKLRVADLTIDDYTTGTVSVAAGSTTVTGTGTSWQPTVGNNETRWIRINFPYGDDMWYQVASVNSTTSITLVSPYYGTTNVTNGTYTLGQMPILLEDFQDLIVHRPLYVYYSSVRPDSTRAAEFKALYDEGITRLDDYLGSKSVNVDLGQPPPMVNPNLFYYA